jgi:DNA-binding transcriptional LysR family regulator
VRAGLGIGILPCAFADGDAMPELRVPVWVLMHESVRDIPRVRAAAEFITESLRAASA